MRLARLCIVCGAVASLLGAADPEASIAEIKSELEATMASLSAIRVQYSRNFEPDPTADWGPNPIPEPGPPQHYLWARSGTKLAFAMDFDEAGKPRNELSFDGKLKYQGVRLERHPDWPKKIYITRDSGYTSSTEKFDYVLGFGVPLTTLTLPQVLALPTSSLKGIEAIDGAPCHRIDISGVSAVSPSPVQVSAWMDAAQGMLPRRLSISYDLNAIKANSEIMAKLNDESLKGIGQMKIVWTASDFRDVPNPAASTGTTRIPWHLIQEQLSSQTIYDVASVELRSSAPASWFRPEAPPGTLVFDLASGKHTASVVGGPRALPKLVGEPRERVTALSDKLPGAVDARPPALWNLFTWLLVGSLSVMVTAVVWWSRSH